MKEITQMLALMERPAFCAEDGHITAVNAPAAARQFAPGMAVAELLVTGREEYPDFREGCMWLQLQCCSERYEASVTAMGERQIFALELSDADSELRVLALAAHALREPLGNVMALVEELPWDTDPDAVARIERGLYQLLRIVGNMSPMGVFRPEMMELGALLQEIWDKVQPACDSRGIRLSLKLPNANVFSCVDPELLTRAIHNLLSNSLKYASPGDTLRLELKLLRRRYQISLRDCGGAGWPITDPFTRYRREPGTGDGRDGLGLGLKLVQLAATAHGGMAMLVPDGQGLEAALSLPLRQDTPLRSPRIRLSYAGERDPMLVELSDVLPPEFYKK